MWITLMACWGEMGPQRRAQLVREEAGTACPVARHCFMTPSAQARAGPWWQLCSSRALYIAGFGGYLLCISSWKKFLSKKLFT
jgi:hypothetical protein